MKRLFILLGLSLIASGAFAAGCGELGIVVKNDSNHNCVLKNKIIYYGTLTESTVPTNIPAQSTSQVFYGSQDDVGVGILLTYKCDDELVRFYSWQNYCGFPVGAGTLGGSASEESTLSLSYQTQQGGYLFGRPGQVTWRIS
jgi:hypothetical protein